MVQTQSDGDEWKGAQLLGVEQRGLGGAGEMRVLEVNSSSLDLEERLEGW